MSTLTFFFLTFSKLASRLLLSAEPGEDFPALLLAAESGGDFELVRWLFCALAGGCSALTGKNDVRENIRVLSAPARAESGGDSEPER